MSAEETPPSDLQGTLKQSGEAQAASQDLSVPKDVAQHADAPKIPGYVLTSPLGRGAFAQVWKAWQVRTHKWVAVKVFIQKSGVNWLFLQREVERLVRLDKHPNIVSLLDADLTAEPPYYVMDHLEGGSLEKYVDPKNPAPVDKAAKWMEDICEALAFVHSKGLIHCDLKPGNILLDGEGRVRVADFGQSRIVTESSGALGTLFYMAPEQAVVPKEGEQLQPDVRWDVYGLGSTMFAILTGTVPHGDEDSRKKLTAAKSLEERLGAYRDIIARRPLPNLLATAKMRLDESLAAIATKCLRPDPGQRYATLMEVDADFAARREGRPMSLLARYDFYRWERHLKRRPWLPWLLLLTVTLGAAMVAELQARQALLALREKDLTRAEKLASQALAADLEGLLRAKGLRENARGKDLDRFVGAHLPAIKAEMRRQGPARPRPLSLELADPEGNVAASDRDAGVGRSIRSLRRADGVLDKGGHFHENLLEMSEVRFVCSEVFKDSGWAACVRQQVTVPPDWFLARYGWGIASMFKSDRTAGAAMMFAIIFVAGLGGAFALLLMVRLARLFPALQRQSITEPLKSLSYEDEGLARLAARDEGPDRIPLKTTVGWAAATNTRNISALAALWASQWLSTLCAQAWLLRRQGHLLAMPRYACGILAVAAVGLNALVWLGFFKKTKDMLLGEACTTRAILRAGVQGGWRAVTAYGGGRLDAVLAAVELAVFHHFDILALLLFASTGLISPLSPAADWANPDALVDVLELILLLLISAVYTAAPVFLEASVMMTRTAYRLPRCADERS